MTRTVPLLAACLALGLSGCHHVAAPADDDPATDEPTSEDPSEELAELAELEEILEDYDCEEPIDDYCIETVCLLYDQVEQLLESESCAMIPLCDDVAACLIDFILCFEEACPNEAEVDDVAAAVCSTEWSACLEGVLGY